jgi:Family of unknown function (DUF5996)
LEASLKPFSQSNLTPAWPALPLSEWKDTYDTLHMWTQVVGKVRLALSPLVNHWWEVALYVTARGLTTSPIPYPGGIFEIEFDFIDHKLCIELSDGRVQTLGLKPMSVARFYRTFMSMLHDLAIPVKIWPMPSEVPNPIPFDRNEQHASYDPEYANRFWRILVTVDTILKEFRAGFIGKSSPVHFFWGSFDLAVTRFSGRSAPEKKGADSIYRLAYSHEVSSAGFWPGSGDVKGAAFYSYTVPQPSGFSQAPVRPPAAFYSPALSEFLLMYDDVRQSPAPAKSLLDFLQTTYDAGATLGNWDRANLEMTSSPAVPKVG